MPPYDPTSDIAVVVEWRRGYADDRGRAAAEALWRLRHRLDPTAFGQASFEVFCENRLDLDPSDAIELIDTGYWTHVLPPTLSHHGVQILGPGAPRVYRIKRSGRASPSTMPDREPGPATADEYHHLVRAAQKRLHVARVHQAAGIRLQAARDVALLACTFVLGLAPRELIVLDAENYDALRGQLTVRDRVLPTPGHVGQALDLLAERRDRRAVPLFPTCDRKLQGCTSRGADDFPRTVVARRWQEALDGGGAYRAFPTPSDLRDAIRAHLSASGIAGRAVTRLTQRRQPLSPSEDEAVWDAVYEWERKIRP